MCIATTRCGRVHDRSFCRFFSVIKKPSILLADWIERRSTAGFSIVFLGPLPFLLVRALCLRVQKHRRKLGEIRPLAVLSFQKKQSVPPSNPSARSSSFVPTVRLFFLPAIFYPLLPLFTGAGSSSKTDQAVDRITERPVNHSEGTLWLVSASDRSTTKL